MRKLTRASVKRPDPPPLSRRERRAAAFEAFQALTEPDDVVWLLTSASCDAFDASGETPLSMVRGFGLDPTWDAIGKVLGDAADKLARKLSLLGLDPR